MPSRLAPGPAVQPPPAVPARPAWVVLTDGRSADRATGVPRLRRVLLQVGVAALVVLVAVGLVGALVSRRSAENESVHEAAELSDVLAEAVVQPALTDAMATSTTAAAALDAVVRSHVLSAQLVRVKLWSPSGRILYSDEHRLVGRTFALDADARGSLTGRELRAQVTDLDEPENRFERGQGRLLEVHRPVWTPNGSPLLFESYFRYSDVSARAGRLWRGFAGITVSSIVAVVVLLAPVAWTLVARARRAQHQREEMLRRAVDASSDERRRIAAGLHDGVVQDLVAAALALSGNAAAADDPTAADRLQAAAGTVRSGIGGLRSLLVEIHPPHLHEAGLERTLQDLAATLPVDVELAVDPGAVAELDENTTEAMFRVAQESLRNAAAHAGTETVRLSLRPIGGDVVLEVTDDGRGFDPGHRPDGHFGLHLMVDAARRAGGVLALSTAPQQGTAWRLAVAQ